MCMIMCMIMLQEYIICIKKLISINTWLFQKKKRKLGSKYDPVNLFFKIYNYDDWFKNEELVDKEESVDLPHMQPLECDEKLQKGKGLKSLTPKKLLIRLPILLAQIKAGKNSYKFLKNQTNITSIVSTQ